MHFTLSPPACHMEIREGYGTGGQRVAKPVHVGDPLTLMIFMRSQWDGFDILVNDCYVRHALTIALCCKQIPMAANSEFYSENLERFLILSKIFEKKM